VLFVPVVYRLLAPGSEWRLHREWFQRSALADLLGEDAGLAEIHKLYRCHDRLLVHKHAVFDHLVGRWRDLFNISYDVLLYDLTSTYFEADPPFPEGDKLRFGYSRDHRPVGCRPVWPRPSLPCGSPTPLYAPPRDATRAKDAAPADEETRGRACTRDSTANAPSPLGLKMRCSTSSR
jgi:hypothetical protein